MLQIGKDLLEKDTSTDPQGYSLLHEVLGFYNRIMNTQTQINPQEKPSKKEEEKQPAQTSKKRKPLFLDMLDEEEEEKKDTH